MELEEQQCKHYVENEEAVMSKMMPKEDEKYRVIKEIVGNRYEKVQCDDISCTVLITSPEGQSVNVDCKKMTVEGDSETLKETLTSILKQVENSMSPMLIP